MNKAIVTGANGFVGTWLLKELVSNGIEVLAVVKNETSNIDTIKMLPNVEIVFCEMNNIQNLPEKIESCNADVFFHLAWDGSTGANRGNYNIQLKNVEWTLNAVNVASVLGCKRFIGAGTLAEFDCNTYIPVNGSIPNAISCYGTAKIAAHYMSKAECNRIGLEHVWAYISNTYGVGNRTQNFVNFASLTMLKGNKANFTPGEQLYDFVYVSDIAQGLYRLAERGKPNHAYYIGSTKPAQLKHFIKVVRDVIDPDIPLYFGAIPFNGVSLPAETFDCSMLVEHTGYSPEISFQEGMKITVQWLQEQVKEGLL